MPHPHTWLKAQFLAMRSIHPVVMRAGCPTYINGAKPDIIERSDFPTKKFLVKPDHVATMHKCADGLSCAKLLVKLFDVNSPPFRLT